MANVATDLSSKPSRGIRFDPDVVMLLQSALRRKGGKNLNREVNQNLRDVLTPQFGGKRVLALQAKLGLTASNSIKVVAA